MTLEEFSGLLNAKRIKRGRYMALCPAHADRHRSLSIDAGDRSKSPHPFVFVCRSHGCSSADILKAMGLTWRDIMGDRVTDPRKLRELEVKRMQREAEERREKYHVRCLLDQYRFWNNRRDQLARDLAEHDSDKTARLFHAAMDRFRDLEKQVAPILHLKEVL